MKWDSPKLIDLNDNRVANGLCDTGSAASDDGSCQTGNFVFPAGGCVTGASN